MCGLHNHGSLVSLKAITMTTCKVANDFTHILRYLCNRQKLLGSGPANRVQCLHNTLHQAANIRHYTSQLI